MTKKKFTFKKFYKNGDLRLLGSSNLYAIWNEWMYFLHIYHSLEVAMRHYRKTKAFKYGRAVVRLKKIKRTFLIGKYL